MRIGSAQALIYRTRERKLVGRKHRSYERFTVTYYRTDGVKQIRCRKSYSSLQAARFEAERAAAAISKGEADILKLTSADRGRETTSGIQSSRFSISRRLAVISPKHLRAKRITSRKRRTAAARSACSRRRNSLIF